MKNSKKSPFSSFIAAYKRIFMPAEVINEKRWWAYEVMQWLALVLALAALFHS